MPPVHDTTPLTEKQKKFVAAYVGEAQRNGSKAAKIAGYKNPRQSASYLLTKPNIDAELQRLRQKTEDKTTLTRIKTLQLLQEIATDPKQSASDRIKALDVRNKMNAEYVQRIQMNFDGMDNHKLNEESADVMRADGWICISPDDPSHARHKELLE
jgi:phage terminase small subunit